MTLWTRTPSPIGDLLLVGDGDVLNGLYVADHEKCAVITSEWKQDDDAFEDVRRQLGEYFAGTRRTFDLRIELHGSPFQRQVWDALLEVPYGETASYGQIARRLGRPTAARAVGAANGRNPVSIIVPCHRVIGASGTLTGYGWGTDRKAWLLDHEAPAR
ncbi:MAG TPA: methylated-DNA--[protein]-cysteine S-methyltransferase [Acidimicrobiales bacterium]|nr:methylated-DNA--[protein]-cysteine S-methyltransferase [Acidimicrobiales bacterium]